MKPEFKDLTGIPVDAVENNEYRTHTFGETTGNIKTIEQYKEEIFLQNKKIQQYEEEISELKQLKAKIFSILSHDLRSPFNGLFGFANFLAEEIDGFNQEEIRMFANGICSSAKGLLELIDDLFNWAKAECGEIDYKPMNIELNYIVDEIFFLFKLNAESKNIKLFNNIPKNTFAYADLHTIKIVFKNLISNAVKFTNQHGEINVNLNQNPDGYREISVADNGVGINECSMQKLFKIGLHYTTRGTANEKGTGLGLILSRELIERNGGMLKIESKEGAGSTFTVLMPKANFSSGDIHI